MKKLMIAVLMMLGTSTAFAGDSEPLKAVLQTKSYTEAVALLQQNLNQLLNAQEKAKAYNHVTKLALADFDRQNTIIANNLQAQLTKQPEQPYDTLGYYEAAYNALVNGLECIKYDQEPNEKGKVKPKYMASLQPLLANARLQLVTAGNYYATRTNQDGVLKYWGAFLDTDDNPLFAEGKASEKPYIGQVAYYTGLFANQAKDYARAEKYADIALADSALHNDAQTLKFYVAQQGLKTHADSLAYLNKMKATYAQDPNNETVFSLLCDLYSGLNMTSELKAFVDEKIAADPNNFTAWAVKGQTLMNEQQVAKTPNWDETIKCYQKAIEIKSDNSIVLTYLGFALNQKADQMNDNAQRKAILTESMGYLEQARQIDPDQKLTRWSLPLRTCYYVLYGPNDARYKEIDALVNN